jgi:hypothetical protein
VKRDTFTLVVKIALAIGFVIEAYVGLLGLFAPQLMLPLLDVPVGDTMLAHFAGGEFIVVALVYAIAFRDPARFRVLLWICCVDQLFGVIVPAYAVTSGAWAATFKTVAPIPLQALLALFFIGYALRPRTT